MISLPIKRGEFVALSSGSGTIVAGTPVGDILILTPPSSQRVRITHLSTTAAGDANQNPIALSFGDTEIISSAGISGGRPTGIFISIGSFQSYVSGAPPYRNYKYITGKADEAFKITLGSVSPTVTPIYYSYEFGE